MKIRAIVVGLLLCALMVSGAMCQSGTAALQKPKVSNVPAGWYLSADDAYNPSLGYGLVEYTDSWDGDFVMIFWGDIPASFVGHESDSNALIAQAVSEAIFSPQDTGMLTVAGRLGGYAEAYDAYYGTWETEIVFVYDSTYVDIYTAYNGSEWDIGDAIDIIESIYF